MPRIPGWLKAWLVPIWNGTHRFVRRTGQFVTAILQRRCDWCSACGRFGPLLFEPRVVPPRLAELWGLTPEWTRALARRESCHCSWCGAKLRTRRIARVLLETYPVGDPPQPASSIAALVRRPEFRGLRVAEFNIIEGLHDVLLALPGLAYSEFREGVEPGTVVDGIRCENLTRITYPDESFDLVLTSETLEHVPDLEAALAEIRRILVPGGRHIFTVPVLPGVLETFARADLRPDGTIESRGPLIHHPGGDHGYPVFTEFGADFPELLRTAGFETSVSLGGATEEDMAQVFLCRKSDVALPRTSRPIPDPLPG